MKFVALVLFRGGRDRRVIVEADTEDAARAQVWNTPNVLTVHWMKPYTRKSLKAK